MNLTEPIALNARFRADVPAIIQAEQTISFRVLDAVVNAWAENLQRSGAKRGDVIGVCLQDRPVHLVAALAILRFGAVLLPMDWRWTVAEQAKIVKAVKARFMFAERYRPVPEGIEILIANEVDEPALVERGRWPGDLDHAPAILGLSSGTTGDPKAVITTHRQYRARMLSYMLACGLGREDRYFSALPLAFSAGRLFALAYLAAGATVVICPPLSSPAEIAEGTNASAATTVCLVPSASRAMLGLPASGSGPLLPGVRVLMSIGAPLHPEQRAAIRQRLAPNLIDIYATTGGSLACVIHPEEQDRHPGSVGRPAMEVNLQIVDEQDRRLPADAVGRIRYRSPGLPSGFFQGLSGGDEDLRGGWFYPGDYGALNAEGYLFLKGRRSEIVIRGGVNVFTPEVERAIAAHPSVSEVAVVGIASAEFGEDLVAFVRSATEVDGAALVRHCRKLLAPYKIPQQFRFVEALPRNSAGKVRKRELVQAAGLAPAMAGFVPEEA